MRFTGLPIGKSHVGIYNIGVVSHACNIAKMMMNTKINNDLKDRIRQMAKTISGMEPLLNNPDILDIDEGMVNAARYYLDDLYKNLVDLAESLKFIRMSLDHQENQRELDALLSYRYEDDYPF